MKVAIACNLRPDPHEAAGLPAGLDAETDAFLEWDDPATVGAMRDALARDHEVVVLDHRDDRAGPGDFERRLLAARPDMVFNVVEGVHGPDREAEVPALLERHGIPFTGSGSATLRTCLDKAATQERLRGAAIPTPASRVVRDPAELAGVDPFPLIVKPLYEGSSKGITGESVVRSAAALRTQVEQVLARYRQPAIVETFLSGREFTVALLGNGAELEALPAVEMDFSTYPEGAVPIYGYEGKWVWDSVEHPLNLYVCPARIPAPLAASVADTARRAFLALECRDWCRVDIRLDGAGLPHVLEANPLPGVVPDLAAPSAFVKAADAAGLSHADLVRRVLAIACRRLGMTA